MNTKQKNRWWLNLILFAGFLLAFLLDFTGLAWHQWLGLGVGLLAAVHFFSHWQWVEQVTSRFFSRTSPRARLYYAIDLGLWIGFFNITLTGLLISSWLNLPATFTAAWKVIHILISAATLLLTVVKLALHWRWIANAARAVFARSTAPAAVSAAPTASQGRPVSRREFVKVLGVVGAASLLPLGKSLEGLQSTDATDSTASQTSTTARSTSSSAKTAASLTTSSGASSTCAVQCNRRCSYPGHCRRYTDRNSNGRCDLGECA